MRVLIYTNLGFTRSEIHKYDRSIWIPHSSEIPFVITEIYAILSGKGLDPSFFIEKSLCENNIDIPHTTVTRPTPAIRKNTNRIAFYTQSDTLSSSLMPICRNLSSDQFKIYTPPIDKEKAARPLDEQNFSYETLSTSSILNFKPDLIFLLNDWSKIPRGLIATGHKNNIPTICLQESIISFGDHQRRMEHSDYVMIQGLKTFKHLEQKNYFLTGNPRYTRVSETKEEDPYMLINCNFTYGVEENHRYMWLDSVVKALENRKWSYKIAKHPRDRGDLSKYKNVIPSSASVIAKYLGNCAGVISRFSSLLHEAIVNEVPAIYFNPHRESLEYDFEPDGEIMYYTSDPFELEGFLARIKNSSPLKETYNRYLINHCFNPELDTPRLIADLLTHLDLKAAGVTINDRVNSIIYAPWVRKQVDLLKTKF